MLPSQVLTQLQKVVGTAIIVLNCRGVTRAGVARGGLKTAAPIHKIFVTLSDVTMTVRALTIYNETKYI